MSSIINNVFTLSFPYQQGLVNAGTLALDKLQNYLNTTNADYNELLARAHMQLDELFVRAHMQLDKLLPEPPRDEVYYKLVAIDSAIRENVYATHMKITNAFTGAFTNQKYKNVLIASFVLLSLVFFLLSNKTQTKTVYEVEEAEAEAEEEAAIVTDSTDKEKEEEEFYEMVKLVEERERLVDLNMKLIRRLKRNIQKRSKTLDYQYKILARKSKNFAKKVRKSKAAKMKVVREMPMRQTAPFVKGFYNEQELQRNVWNDMKNDERVRVLPVREKKYRIKGFYSER